MESVQVRSIVRVKKKKKIPVYDITVPGNHNFVLANGLVVHNCQPYEILKNAMYEKRVTLLDDEDQTNELVSLEKHESGKVDKCVGGHDDTSQCLAGAIYLASKAKEEIMASGAVLLKQLDSSKEIAGNSLPPAEAVAREIEQHFASYSPEAKVVSQKSELRDSWDAFFGKAGEKKRPDESFNISSRWG